MAQPSPAMAQSPSWSTSPPAEQGDYWHWDGDADHAPMIYHVMWSGTAKKCFLSIGQYDIAEAIWCDTFGGWWLRIAEPALPTTTRRPAQGETALVRAMASVRKESDLPSDLRLELPPMPETTLRTKTAGYTVKVFGVQHMRDYACAAIAQAFAAIVAQGEPVQPQDDKKLAIRAAQLVLSRYEALRPAGQARIAEFEILRAALAPFPASADDEWPAPFGPLVVRTEQESARRARFENWHRQSFPDVEFKLLMGAYAVISATPRPHGTFAINERWKAWDAALTDAGGTLQ